MDDVRQDPSSVASPAARGTRVVAVTPRRAGPMAGTLGQILVLIGAIAASQATLEGVSPGPAIATFVAGAAMMMGVHRRGDPTVRAVSSPVPRQPE